jgi:DNA polymerase I-like protein with 3'-5' exonuclease and polymerase domains
MGAERQAVNSLIQGSAADLIKLAMIRLNNLLPEDMRLILSVHDELVVLAPESRAEECASLVKEAMLGADIQKLLRVPLSSDVKIVNRWSEAK